MIFNLGCSVSLEKQIEFLKAIQRLDQVVFFKRKLKTAHGLTHNQLRAATVLQFAPDSNSFAYLSKSVVEHVLGSYVSRIDLLFAADALGIGVEDGELAICKRYVRALERLAELRQPVNFPPVETY